MAKTAADARGLLDMPIAKLIALQGEARNREVQVEEQKWKVVQELFSRMSERLNRLEAKVLQLVLTKALEIVQEEESKK